VLGSLPKVATPGEHKQRIIVHETLASDIPAGIPQDPLQPYRDGLKDLASAAEKLTTLRQVETSLRADADGVASQRDKVLADSVVSSGDDEGAIEELSRLRSRGELFERKIGDVSGRVADVEQELSFLRRYMLRDAAGSAICACGPARTIKSAERSPWPSNASLPPSGTRALETERLGFAPVDPRTNREMLAGRR
jgi:hypothetical protein